MASEDANLIVNRLRLEMKANASFYRLSTTKKKLIPNSSTMSTTFSQVSNTNNIFVSIEINFHIASDDIENIL